MKDLNALLEKAVGWEDHLSGYFTELESAVTDHSCSEMLGLIKSHHLEAVTILHDISSIGLDADEWLPCDPNNPDPTELLVPPTDIPEHSPTDILSQLLAYEECIQSFYLCIAERIVSRKEHELFNALANTKNRLIILIRSCLEYKQGN